MLKMSESQTESNIVASWITISQVQETTGADVEAITSVAKRAYQAGQDWVKREPYPTPQSRTRWLINIASETYQYHQKRWMKNSAKQTELTRLEDVPKIQQMVATSELPDMQVKVIQQGIAETQATAEALTKQVGQWTEFGHWLAAHGVIVYQNGIDHEQDWRWRWGDDKGSGYTSLYAAMIAALQHHITKSELPAPLRMPLVLVIIETFLCLVRYGKQFWNWLMS